MAAGNTDFSTVVTATMQNYRPKLIENLMGRQALLWLLKKKGYQTEEAGSRSIVQPLLYGDNSTVSSFSGYDLLDLTPQAGITAAEYYWKYVAGSVVISEQEEFENSGDKTKVFNLLDAKIKQLEISFKKEINSQLFGDGTGNGGKDITGLALAVEDGAAWSQYGGIDSSDADNSWWRNQYFDFDTFAGGASTFGATAGNSVMGLKAMRNMFNLCGIDGESPDLIITTRDLYEAYEANIEGQKLRVSNLAMADAGFRNIEFKGVPIVFDDDMDDEGMLFLNSTYLKFVIGKGRNFKMTPFQRPENQLAKVGTMVLAAQLTTSKRDVHGRIVAMTE